MSGYDFDEMRKRQLAMGISEEEADKIVAMYRRREEDFARKEAEIGRAPLVHRMKRTNTSRITDCCKRSLDEPEFEYDYVSHLTAKVTCPEDKGR